MGDFIVTPQELGCTEPSPNAGASYTSAVTYDGSSLGCLSVSNGQNLNTVLSNINSITCSTLAQIDNIGTTYNNLNQSISEINESLASLNCTAIDTASVSWSCITPADTSLCAALEAIESKLCTVETNLAASGACPDDGNGSGSSVALYRPYEAKPYVHPEPQRFDLSGYGNGAWNYDAGSTTDETGCTTATDGGTEDVTSTGGGYINSWWWARNSKSSGYKVYKTAIGAPEPAPVSDEVPLYRLETDGVGTVSLSLDQREYSPYDETHFRSTTDVSSYVNTITSTQLNLDAKITYNNTETFTDDKDIVAKKYVDDQIASVTGGIFTDLGIGNGVYYDAGTLALGTNSPDTGFTFHLAGTMRLADGTEAAGRYLVSDATGGASWQDLSIDFFIEDEGSALGNYSTMNFVGSGVAVTDVGGVATVTITGGVTALNDLSDVSVASATGSETMRYNGVDWVSSSFLTNDGTGIGIGTVPSVSAVLHIIDAAGTDVLKIAGTGGAYLDINAAGATTQTTEWIYKYTNGGASPLGAGKILMSDVNGKATWETFTGAVSGSGVTDYIPRWSSASVLAAGTMRDNGTVTSIGGALDSSNMLTIYATTPSALVVRNTGTSGLAIGQNIEVNGAASGIQWGQVIEVSAGLNEMRGQLINMNMSSGIGGYGQSIAITSPTAANMVGSQVIVSGTNSGENIAFYTESANSGTGTHYALQMRDGNEATGKFIRSMDAAGKAQWQDITSADISDLGTTLAAYLPLAGGTMTGNITYTDTTYGLDFQGLTGGTNDAHIKSRVGSTDISDLLHPIIMAQDSLGVDTNTYFGWRNGNNKAVISGASDILFSVGGTEYLGAGLNNNFVYKTATIADITAGSGKTLISKEWANAQYAPAGTYALVGSYTSGFVPYWDAVTNTLTSSGIEYNGAGAYRIGGTPVGATRFFVGHGNSQPTGIAVVPVASSVGSKGIEISSVTSNSGDNIGMYINVSNAGAGNAYLLQLQDGSEGVGKVLTSDASGRANWQTLSSGGNVSNSGTPLDNQIPVWVDATTIEGDSRFTYDAAGDGIFNIEYTDSNNFLRSSVTSLYKKSTSNGAALILEDHSSTASHSSSIITRKYDGLNTAVTTGQDVGRLTMQVYDGSFLTTGFEIDVVSTETFGGGTGATSITFTKLNTGKVSKDWLTVAGDGSIQFQGQVYSDLPATLAPTGTTQTINWNEGNGTVLDLELVTGTLVLSMTNPKAGATYMIKIIQDSTTPRDITWPVAVKWPGGTAPTISTGSNAVDTVVLFYDGISYYANFAQNYS